MPRSWRWSIVRSTLQPRRNRALTSGSVWAMRAAWMRASCTPTDTVRLACLALVQQSRRGQEPQAPAGNTNDREGRPLWSLAGRASAGGAPPRQGGAGGPQAVTNTGCGDRPPVVTPGALAHTVATL